MLTAADARRRWFGTFFLIIAGGLMVWGLTFLDSVLSRNPVFFTVYWLFCFLVTLLSFVIAIQDIRVIRRRIRKEQKAAFEKAFQDVIEHEKAKLKNSQG